MGLFRIWARRSQKQATAKPTDEQPDVVVAAQGQPAHRKPNAEVRPNPDQPGWGRIVGQTISKAREER